MQLFSVDYIIFSILGYDMSLLELAGTLSGGLCVWLTAKNRIICWPIGLLNVIFFFFLFYQVRLYSDMFLQVFFFFSGLYGWYCWQFPKETAVLKVSSLGVRYIVVSIAFIFVATGMLYSLISQLHILLPVYFPEPAFAPLRDSFCTVLSIFAQFMMAKKKLEGWLLWILVDVISCVYYYEVGILLVAIEYVIFGIIAVKGFILWKKELDGYAK